MSYGKCSNCDNWISLEEFNAGIELRPDNTQPVLCFACIGQKLLALTATNAEQAKEIERLNKENLLHLEGIGNLVARISTLTAEIERLKKEYNIMFSQHDSLQRRCNKQQIRISTLTAALEKYGNHKTKCREQRQYDFSCGTKLWCTCGLEQALERGK